MAGFSDAVGRFRGRQAQASEASEAIEADELAAVEELAEIEDDPLPQSPASLHTLLRAARERREVLLRSGNVEAVIVVDSEITRLVVGLEAAQARIDADYAEAPAREHARLLDVWRRVQRPKLEAAHARRDELAYLLWLAVDAAADAEQECGRDRHGARHYDRANPAGIHAQSSICGEIGPRATLGGSA